MFKKTKRPVLIGVLAITLVIMLAASAGALRFSWPFRSALLVVDVINTGKDMDKTLYTVVEGKIEVLDGCAIFICGTPGNQNVTVPGLGSVTLSASAPINQALIPKKGFAEVDIHYPTDLEDFWYFDENGDPVWGSPEYETCCFWDTDCDPDVMEDPCNPYAALQNATGMTPENCRNPNWWPIKLRGSCAEVRGDRYKNCVDPNDTSTCDDLDPADVGVTYYCATDDPFAPAPNWWDCTEPPQTEPDTLTVNVDSVTTIKFNKGVLSNDEDPDKGPSAMTAALVYSPPFSGELVLNADGGFEYTAPSDPGFFEFTYAVFDGLAWSDETPFTITVEN